MAGFSKLFVVGGEGGFLGSDGVNPIEFMILVGDADRQWFEPHYFDTTISPIGGGVRYVLPARPDEPDGILDACLAFAPHHFQACKSIAAVNTALTSAERLDFAGGPDAVPALWFELREQARPHFNALSIWQAELAPYLPT